MSFCTKCGHSLPNNAHYCPRCGTPVVTSTQRKRGSSRTEDLIRELKQSSWPRRRDAAEELGKIGDEEAVEPLIEALEKDDFVLVSTVAADALSKIGGARAVQALARALKEDRRRYEQPDWVLNPKDVWVAEEAARALAKMGEPGLEPLIEALSENDSQTRAYAAEALAEMGDARAVEPLIKALKAFGISGIIYDRLFLGALARISSAKGIDPLIQALRDPEASLRRDAARVLGMIGDARAVIPLGGALKDDDNSVQSEAAEALSKIGGRDAEEEIAATGRYPSLLLQARIKTMERNRDTEGLIGFLTHTSSSTRMTVASTLHRLGWTPKNESEKAHYLVSSQNWDEAAKSGENMVEPLIQALKDENKQVRRGAVTALGEIGDPRAIEPLNQAQREDKDTGVQQDAFEALMKYEKRAIKRMEDQKDMLGLIVALHHDIYIVRKEAAQALGRIGDAQTIGPLTQAYVSEQLPPVREALFYALREINERLGTGPR